MATLMEQPELALELLAIMVKRAGGEVWLSDEDDIRPYTIHQTLAEDGAGKRWMILRYTEDQTGQA